MDLVPIHASIESLDKEAIRLIEAQVCKTLSVYDNG